MRRRTLTLRAWVIIVVTAVVISSQALVAALTARVMERNMRKEIGENALNVARLVASLPEVRMGFQASEPAAALAPLVEHIQERTNVDFVVIMDMNSIRYTHPNKDLIGLPFTGGDEGRALQGEEYYSSAVGISGPSIRGFAPIYAYTADGRQVGVVAVGIFQSGLQQALGELYSGVLGSAFWGVLVGILGAVLLASSIKRAILNLEPSEIARLQQEQQAMLYSLREGIIAINGEERISLVNETARRIMGLKEDCLGQPIAELIPSTRLPEVMKSGRPEYDQEQLVGDRVILTNRVPIVVAGKVVGALATFRDRTEIQGLMEELTGVKQLVRALRAQSHEFSNKLHTILGLIQLGEYKEAASLINDTSDKQQRLVNLVVRRLKNPAVAGLLLGKIAEARERQVQLMIRPDSHLEELPPLFGTYQVVSVLGNLLQNAIEVVENQPAVRRKVAVAIYSRSERLELFVHDRGPGIPAAVRSEIFAPNFTTKEGARGLGLYLVWGNVQAAGGRIQLRTSDAGTSFRIVIPYRMEGEAT
ncbi:MAG: sensor histidine kinase [Firmicutes bacterium]|nr:sensor histidine kinase [Bacillota bacterium]